MLAVFRVESDKNFDWLTSLLLPPPLLVADLDGADGEDDGDDEELQ